MSGVRMWLKPGKAVAFPVFLFILLAFTNISFARSYNFPLVSIEAEIQKDGSMQVTEERTVEFNGRYTGLFQYINKQQGVSITGVEVKEGGVAYTRHNGTSYGPAGTYYVIDEPGRLYVDWSFEAVDEVRTFTLHYSVMGAVEVHNDVADFYWQFIGDGWETTTKRALAKLTLPAGAQQEEVLAWGHGPLHGTVSIESPREIAWEISPLQPGAFLEGRVAFPTRLVPTAAVKTGRTALPGIIAEEKAWARTANRQRLAARLDWVLAGLVILIAASMAFLFWLRYGREFQPEFEGEYYRELPAEYSPAELGVLWRFGRPLPDDITATILDLARRGYLYLEEHVPQSGGILGLGKKTGYRIVRLDKTEGLAEHEQDLLSFLSRVAGGSKELAFSELEDYARKRREAFASFWRGWQGILEVKGKRLGFFDKDITRPKVLRTLTGVVLVVVGAALLATSAATGLRAFPLAAGISGIGLIVAALVQRRRSRQGVEDFVRWRAFRRFLLHFSEMERHEIPSLVIWEHYLVYAVTLGVAKQVLKQLQLVYPDLRDGSHSFGYGWYGYRGAGGPSFSGIGSSIEAFSGSLRQSVRTATSPSSSGSGRGGGFSGGGGGGRGGGGGGAR